MDPNLTRPLIRNIGIFALIVGIAGYILPVWNGLSIIDMANLCDLSLHTVWEGAEEFGRFPSYFSLCGQIHMMANLVYAAILIGVVMILYSALKK